MKKNNKTFLNAILKNRSLRYGTNSLILIAAVVAIAVLANVLVGLTGIKWDLTPNKLYSIGDTTKKVLDELDKEVIIYGLFDETRLGSVSEYSQFIELLEHYGKNNYITVRYVDPDKNPGILLEIDPEGILSNVSSNYFVVKSGNKLRGLSYYDLYSTRYDQQTFQIQTTGTIAEQGFTGAIKFVTAEHTPTIYFTTGHDEKDPSSTYSKLSEILVNNNFMVSTINLITEEKVPEDAELLVFASPKRDITMDERDKIIDYLKGGGHGIFMFDYLESDAQFPNFENIFMDFNISISYDKIKENDSNRHLPQNPYTTLLDVRRSDLSSGGYNILFPNSRSVNILKNKKEYINEMPLAVTSSMAVGEMVNKSRGDDVEGPLNAAVAVEHGGWGAMSKITVIGTSSFLDDKAADAFGPYYNNGLIFFLESVNWMADIKEEVKVDTKYYTAQYLEITQQQANYMGILVVGVLPLLILAAGMVVYLRRRHL